MDLVELDRDLETRDKEFKCHDWLEEVHRSGMMPLKSYKCDIVRDHKRLVSELKQYQKEHRCCAFLVDCDHPPLQSDSNVHRFFPVLRESFFISFKKYLNDLHKNNKNISLKNFRFSQLRMWTYITKNKKKPASAWHVHDGHISGLLYLTPTKVRTIFNLPECRIYTMPAVNRWFFWPNFLPHKPEVEKETKADRVVIGTSIFIESWKKN